MANESPQSDIEKPIITLDHHEPAFGDGNTQTSILSLSELIPTVTAVPSWTPRKFSEQFVFVRLSGTSYLYGFDPKNNSWVKVGPSSSIPTITISTLFETKGRGSSDSIIGTGTVTLGVDGLYITTGSTVASSSNYYYSFASPTGFAPFSYNPQFSCYATVLTAPTIDGSCLFGVGYVSVSGTGHSFVNAHFGFEIAYTAATATLYATNSDGSTRTNTDITSGITVTNENIYAAIKSATDIKFYVNGVLKATHTTNFPTGTASGVLMDFSISNKSTASEFQMKFGAASYKQEVTS